MLVQGLDDCQCGGGGNRIGVLVYSGRHLGLQWIDSYRITSLVDTTGLPDILNKSVVREAGAWMANYGHYPCPLWDWWVRQVPPCC